jgi:hypothetical protein
MYIDKIYIMIKNISLFDINKPTTFVKDLNIILIKKLNGYATDY